MSLRADHRPGALRTGLNITRPPFTHQVKPPCHPSTGVGQLGTSNLMVLAQSASALLGSGKQAV